MDFIMDPVNEALQRLETKFQRDSEAFPRIFANLLYPEWQQALPASTILHCKPAETLTKPHFLPTGSRLSASHFREGDLALVTSNDLRLLPLTITDIDYHPYLQASRLSIRLQWHTSTKQPCDLSGCPLRLYLNMPWPQVTAAYYCLTQELQEIHWQTSTDIVKLPAKNCQPLGFEAIMRDDPYLLWREYVRFVQQYLFFDILLAEDLRRNSLEQPITLHFILKNHDPRWASLFIPESILLNCVTVVNAVSTLAAPATLTLDASPITIKPLTASIQAPPEIISLTAVSAYTAEEATPIPCYHLTEIPASHEAQAPLVWHALHDQGCQLTIDLPPGSLMADDRLVLQCTVLQCEGELANRVPLPEWDFHWHEADASRLMDCKALLPFTQYLPARDLSLWELLLHSRSELASCWQLIAPYNPVEAALLQSAFAVINIDNKLRIDPEHHYYYHAELHHWQLDDALSLPRCSLMLQIYAAFITALGDQTRPPQIQVRTREGGEWLWPISTNG
jgi:type VI protein secretion system component VasA